MPNCLINIISRIPWLELIRALAPVATALIALRALKNWKHQDKAKREAEFLDSLIETTHTYIAKMTSPITLLQADKDGIEEYTLSGMTKIDGAIDYIQKKGGQASARLRDTLEAIQSTTVHLDSLAAKGQVFDFKDYVACQNAVTRLTWQFRRIEAFAAILSSTTLNWSHPKIRETLIQALDVTADEVRDHLQKNNVLILEFVKKTYSHLYS